LAAMRPESPLPVYLPEPRLRLARPGSWVRQAGSASSNKCTGCDWGSQLWSTRSPTRTRREGSSHLAPQLQHRGCSFPARWPASGCPEVSSCRRSRLSLCPYSGITLDTLTDTFSDRYSKKIRCQIQGITPNRRHRRRSVPFPPCCRTITTLRQRRIQPRARTCTPTLSRDMAWADFGVEIIGE
jgi:hypothetical protein